MLLNIIYYILGISEILVCYYCVSKLINLNFRKYGFYLLVCSVVIGALVTYNRIISHVLVSWAVILFQVILEWVTLITINRRYVAQKVSVVLFVNIEYTLLQLLVMFGFMMFFPDIPINNIYHLGLWSIGVCTIPLILIFLVSRIIEKIQGHSLICNQNNHLLFLAIGLFGLLLIIICQIQIVNVGRNGSIFHFTFLFCWLIFCITIVFYSMKATERAAKEVALEVSNQLLKEKYDDISNVYYSYATVAHDMKNHLIVLEDYCQKGKMEDALEYIARIKEPVSKIKKYISTGNNIIDIILNYKLSVADQDGILIDAEVDPIRGLSITDDDICAILANLIDNAINACRMIVNDQERWINIKIKRQGYAMIINISNSCCTASIKENVENERSLHGYGKISVIQKVQKYKGQCSFKQQENMYEVLITFDDLSLYT